MFIVCWSCCWQAFRCTFVQLKALRGRAIEKSRWPISSLSHPTQSSSTHRPSPNAKKSPSNRTWRTRTSIFVGTVRKIDRNYSHHIYDAFVQIHRIIKGHPQIYELVSSNYEYAKYIADNERSLTSSEALLFRNVTKRAATKFTVNGHVVTITNFGSKQICDSHVTPNDIRVFMLTLESNPHQQHHQYYAKRLVLNSSLIHTKLNSPTNLNSFIESENFEDVKSELYNRQPIDSFPSWVIPWRDWLLMIDRISWLFVYSHFQTYHVRKQSPTCVTLAPFAWWIQSTTLSHVNATSTASDTKPMNLCKIFLPPLFSSKHTHTQLNFDDELSMRKNAFALMCTKPSQGRLIQTSDLWSSLFYLIS